MKILVLGGGISTEREISLRSASAVKTALQIAGHEILIADPRERIDIPANTIVFPILHGRGGEDGTIQLWLEKSKIPFLGTTSRPSEICFNKQLTREKLLANGLPVAKGDEVTAKTYTGHLLTKLPHVLKVCRGGSSIGTYIVRNPAEVDQTKVNEVFNLDDKAVIEELIIGTEITIPILDNDALPVIEIVPPQAGEFDYENKYNGKTKEFCPPKSITSQIQLKAQALAKTVHTVLGARHLSRIDMIVKPNSELIILELNTMPGMTEQSLYPLAAKQAGLTMPALMNKFVELVKRDYAL